MLAIVLLSLPGCRSLAGAADSGAEFRYTARHGYEALLRERCGTKPLLGDQPLLAAESAAMRGFEAQISSTPAARHLDIARADVEYGSRAGKLSCWEGRGKPEFVRQHFDTARQEARSALEALRRLAPAVLTIDIAGLDPATTAEFRALVREVTRGVDWRCRATTAATNDEILAPAKAELAQLRQRIGSTPFAAQFALAEADTRYEHSVTVVECVDPSSEAPAALTDKAHADVKALAARILALAGV
jgi:hypothetical protein